MSLTSLNLSRNRLGGAKLRESRLQWDSALGYGGELAECKDSGAADALARALERNDRLQRLDLARNNLGGAGALAILKAATGLSTLDLSANGLDDAFAEGAGQALEDSSMRLGLLRNGLSARAASGLAERLGSGVRSLCGLFDDDAGELKCETAADRALLRFDLDWRSPRARPLDLTLGGDGGDADGALVDAVLGPGVACIDGAIEASTLRSRMLVTLVLPDCLSGSGVRVVAGALRRPDALPVRHGVV